MAAATTKQSSLQMLPPAVQHCIPHPRAQMIPEECQYHCWHLAMPRSTQSVYPLQTTNLHRQTGCKLFASRSWRRQPDQDTSAPHVYSHRLAYQHLPQGFLVELAYAVTVSHPPTQEHALLRSALLAKLHSQIQSLDRLVEPIREWHRLPRLLDTSHCCLTATGHQVNAQHHFVP